MLIIFPFLLSFSSVSILSFSPSLSLSLPSFLSPSSCLPSTLTHQCLIHSSSSFQNHSLNRWLNDANDVESWSERERESEWGREIETGREEGERVRKGESIEIKRERERLTLNEFLTLLNQLTRSLSNIRIQDTKLIIIITGWIKK